MLAIDKMYDRFKKFGRRVHLTELGVPSFEKDVRPNTTPGDIYCLQYMYYGLWHEMGWNERLQADWVEQFYTCLLYTSFPLRDRAGRGRHADRFCGCRAVKFIRE